MPPPSFWKSSKTQKPAGSAGRETGFGKAYRLTLLDDFPLGLFGIQSPDPGTSLSREYRDAIELHFGVPYSSPWSYRDERNAWESAYNEARKAWHDAHPGSAIDEDERGKWLDAGWKAEAEAREGRLAWERDHPTETAAFQANEDVRYGRKSS